MSKIEFEQISDDEVEVSLPPETPMEMVEQIKKSLMSKGLIEDLVKSTVNVRYFYMPQDSVNKKADELIKSLTSLIKDSESPGEARRRSIAESQGVKYEPNKLVPKVKQEPTGFKTIPTPSAPKKQVMNTLKTEEDEDESDVEKSGTGPKGTAAGAQYVPEANIRRKANNVGDVVGEGPNRNVKAYAGKPGQLSAKQQAGSLAAKQKALNRKQPVKTMKDMTPEELADITARSLKKSWANHGNIPTAAEAIQQTNQSNPVEKAENLMAGQLANLMNNKSMLGQSHRQPSSEDFIMAGEQMGMGTSEEVVKSQDKQWNNTINNWLTEATKPISQRFSSEEEEQAYWDSIKVGDRDDGKSGY
jgi:hypothetical protein